MTKGEVALLLLFLFLLAACTSGQPIPVHPEEYSSSNPTPQQTLTRTVRPSTTPSQVPTVSFPISVGTPFPTDEIDNLQVITSQNISSLSLLASYTGTGSLRSLFFDADETGKYILFQHVNNGPACILGLEFGSPTCIQNAVFGNDGLIYLYEIEPGSVEIRWQGNEPDGPDYSIKYYSPFFQELSALDVVHDLIWYTEGGSASSILYIREISTNREIARWEEFSLDDIIFSSDGKYAFLCADRSWNTNRNDKLIMMDLVSKTILHEKGMTCAYSGLALSRDGQSLALQSLNDLIIIDVETFQIKLTVGNLCKFVDEYTHQDSHAFLADDSALAIACHDWTLEVIDPATGEVLLDQFLPPEGYNSRRIAISPDGTMLVTTSGFGELFIWGVLTE